MHNSWSFVDKRLPEIGGNSIPPLLFCRGVRGWGPKFMWLASANGILMFHPKQTHKFCSWPENQYREPQYEKSLIEFPIYILHFVGQQVKLL